MLVGQFLNSVFGLEAPHALVVLGIDNGSVGDRLHGQVVHHVGVNLVFVEPLVSREVRLRSEQAHDHYQ